MSVWLEVGLLFSILLINRLTFIYVVNRKLHLSFTKNPALTFLYFVFMGLAVAALFWGYTKELFLSDSIVSVFICLVVLTVINPWIYGRLQFFDKKPDSLAKANPDQQFLLIDDKYLLSKTGDVLFQQLVAGILILLMARAGLPFDTLVPVFAGVFFLSHLHMFISTRVIWALYFSLFATLGGFVLPFLILNVDGGVYYAIAIHTLWYVGSGAFFGFLENDTGLKIRRS
jgi:hypothetical protein